MRSEMILAAATEAAEQLYLGMPLPALLAVIAILSAVLTALTQALVKKFRTPVDDRQDKIVVLDASDRLIQRFEKALQDSDDRHGKEIATLANELEELKQEVDTMRRERFGLVSALIRLAQIARKYGGIEAEAEIEAVELPKGVNIR